MARCSRSRKAAGSMVRRCASCRGRRSVIDGRSLRGRYERTLSSSSSCNRAFTVSACQSRSRAMRFSSMRAGSSKSPPCSRNKASIKGPLRPSFTRMLYTTPGSVMINTREGEREPSESTSLPSNSSALIAWETVTMGRVVRSASARRSRS